MNSSSIAFVAACAIHTGAFLSLPQLVSPSLGAAARAAYEVEFRIEEPAIAPNGREPEAGAPRIEEKKAVVAEPPPAPVRTAKAPRPTSPTPVAPEVPVAVEAVDEGSAREAVAVAPVVREPAAADASVPAQPVASGSPSGISSSGSVGVSRATTGQPGLGGGAGSGTTRGDVGGTGKGQPVRLLDLARWSQLCRWPDEAQDAPFDDQVVDLRVVVGSDGRLERIDIVKDPGYGLGRAARACAGRARFQPAQDREGKAIRAESPPIRVRFVR